MVRQDMAPSRHSMAFSAFPARSLAPQSCRNVPPVRKSLQKPFLRFLVVREWRITRFFAGINLRVDDMVRGRNSAITIIRRPPVSTSHIIPKGGFGTTGLLLLLPPPLFWAGNFIVGRAMHEAVPPFALSMWRWIIAFLLLLPFAAPAMRRDLPRYWQHRWTILGVSLSGVFSFNTLIYLGLRTTTAANALLLNSFIPILVVLFGALFFGQVIRRVQVAGLLISLLGVLTIVLQGDWYRLASFSFCQGRSDHLLRDDLLGVLHTLASQDPCRYRPDRPDGHADRHWRF